VINLRKYSLLPFFLTELLRPTRLHSQPACVCYLHINIQYLDSFSSIYNACLPPLQQRVHRTSRLLRRDLKPLFKTKKAKLATKIYSFFKPSESTSTPAAEPGTITIIVPESARKITTGPSIEMETKPTPTATGSDGTTTRTRTPQKSVFTASTRT
jgi:hypothetical protein